MPSILGMNYTVFDDGLYHYEMPQLILKGLQPAHPALIMLGIIEGLRGDGHGMVDFFSSYYDTSTAIALPRRDSEYSGTFKLKNDSKELKAIAHNTELRNWAILLGSDNEYERFQGQKYVKIRINDNDYAVLYGNFIQYLDSNFILDSEHGIFVPTVPDTKARREYPLRTLYALGATPLGRSMGEISVSQDTTISEGKASDLLLALAGYDFRDTLSHLPNKIASRLRNGFVDAMLAASNLSGSGEGLKFVAVSEHLDGPTIRQIVISSAHFGPRIILGSNLDGENGAHLIGFHTQGRNLEELIYSAISSKYII